MSNAAQIQRRLQLFIQAARRGRFERDFTSPNAAAWDLAQTMIDRAEHIPLETLAGACSFAHLAKQKKQTARHLLGMCVQDLPLTPRPSNFKRSAK